MSGHHKLSDNLARDPRFRPFHCNLPNLSGMIYGGSLLLPTRAYIRREKAGFEFTNRKRPGVRLTGRRPKPRGLDNPTKLACLGHCRPKRFVQHLLVVRRKLPSRDLSVENLVAASVETAN